MMMKTTRKMLMGVALLGAMSVGTTGAQAQMMGDAGDMAATMELKNRVDANFDRLFMIHAAMSNMAEVMLGELALRKSRDADVRMVARTTMREHAAAQRDLAKHFRTLGIPMPTNPGPANVALYEKLSRMSGRPFDRMYMAHQVSAHEASITLFAHEIENGKNPTAKAHAQNKLPGIVMHTAMIYATAEKVGAPGIGLRPPAVREAAGKAAMEMKM
jgi:putative membrane protein